jgi:hypothetical protein
MSNGHETGLDAAEDPGGNVYFVGSAQRNFNLGAGNVTVAGVAGFVASYTPRGALRWAQVIDSAGSDEVTTVSVRRTANGIRVFIAGNAGGPVSLGPGGPMLGAGGGVLSFMGEYDETGRLLWSTFMRRTTGAAFTLNDSAIAPSGEVYVTGQYSSFAIQGTDVPNPIFNNNPGGAILLKLNATGVYQWTRWVGTLQTVAVGRVVATDSMNNVIYAGTVDSTVNAGGGERGVLNQLDDLFIAKYDSNNTHLWSSVYGSNNQPQLVTAIAVNPFTDVITIAGHFPGALDFGTGPLLYAAPGPTNLFLANFRPNGVGGQADVSVARSFQNGAAGLSGPASLTYTSDARLFVHDTYSGVATFGGFSVPAGPGRRTVVAELSPSMLVVMNALGFNGTSPDNYSNAVTGCGTNFVCVSGSFNPSYTVAMTTLSNSGLANDDDVYFARVNRP